MATNNVVNNSSPYISAHSIVLSQGASNQTGVLLTNGQLAIGSTGADPVAATLTAGTGVAITNAAGSITISAAGGGMSWSTISGTSQAAAVNNGYVANNAGLVTITLPATAALGSTIEVIGLGAGGWNLTANTGQTIQFGNQVTSSAGSLASTNLHDTVRVVCIVANTTWAVTQSVTGGLTVA